MKLRIPIFKFFFSLRFKITVVTLILVGTISSSLYFIFPIYIQQPSIHYLSIACVIIFGFSILITNFILSKVRKPIKILTSSIHKITKGDLKERSKIKSKDEFGELSIWRLIHLVFPISPHFVVSRQL